MNQYVALIALLNKFRLIISTSSFNLIYFFQWILIKIYTNWYLFGDEQIVSYIITKLKVAFQKMLLQQQCHLWLETGTKAITALLLQQDCIAMYRFERKMKWIYLSYNPENMVRTSPHVLIGFGGPEQCLPSKGVFFQKVR